MKQIIVFKEYANTLCFIFILIFFSTAVISAQLPDRKLQEKYELIIPAPYDNNEPAPEWLQKADMITSSDGVWKDHKFIIKDTLITRIVRIRAGNGPLPVTEHYPVETIGSFDGSQIRGVSLISHVPQSNKAFKEAHKQGFRVIPYVHFTDIHTFYIIADLIVYFTGESFIIRLRMLDVIF
jgi:hypothetical protein